MQTIRITLNGRAVEVEVADHRLLVDFLRQDQGLTGTHVGCDTSQCGACTVHLDGEPVKSCTLLAVQCHERSVTTIEGLATGEDGEDLHPMQAAFQAHHALQCGYCTPGMVMAAIGIVNRHAGSPTRDQIRDELDGNLCRCTGYQNIVDAIVAAAKRMKDDEAA